MKIKIYNTLSRKKEVLQPIEEGHIRLYVCGITSYDYCHIGHARSALVFDMAVRYMRHCGYKVTFVRNFTDIDDKIIKRSQEQGVDASDLAQRFIDEFYTDMDALGILRPDIEPRATGHITEMVEFIKELISRDLAYQSGSDVYYRVTKFQNYGCLSGRTLEDMQAGARIEVNKQKDNPMDFALWKGSKPGEPKWDSPWGQGRPGWHIECSAMSKKYLGETFDIHGGGKDLIFPHHENEIAQSTGATGKTFANVWMHHGFVTISDEKMSKSLGNFLTIRDVLNTYEPEVLRLFLFSTQYRNPLDFSETALRDAEIGLGRMYDCLALLSGLPEKAEDDTPSTLSKKDRKKLSSFKQRFEQAMDNDFNTAQAMGHLFDVVKTLNKTIRLISSAPSKQDMTLVKTVGQEVKNLAGILGLLQQDPNQFAREKRARILDSLSISPDEIEQLIKERTAARAKKDWAASDAVRDQLLAHNIEIYDGPEGTSWDVKPG